jgi:UDP-N-acetylglucosamine--N-acetylmuramyl-(pentapeptide) pyrophosphoryl-undecaprenol N-acetylglucosamine transferase
MKKHILFVGGGSAGHIAPILAVMEAVQKSDKTVRCSYVGQPEDLLSPLIKDSPLKFDSHAVHAGKLHRHFTLNQLTQVRNMVKGMGEARRLIARLKPDVIFAKGGYITVPVVWAAKRKGIPIFCHESDAVPGLANRFVARFAKGIFTTYPKDVYPQFPAEKVVVTGQPVRKVFHKIYEKIPTSLTVTTPLITVIGGSQGARRLNELVSDNWDALTREVSLVHITGRAEYEALVQKRAQLSEAQQARLVLTPFLQDELPALFQKSVIVLSRAGGTIAELAASRACVLLVPLSTAAQDHQWANANVLKRAHAAEVFNELESSQSLLKHVKKMMKDTQLQTGLRAAIGHFDHPDAAERMAAVLLEA